MDDALPFPWETFLRLQLVTDSPVITARTKAREEALTELLEEVAASGFTRDAGAIERHYRALSANRAKKYRHRTELADQVAHHQQHEHQGHDPLELAEFRERAALALAGLPPQDQELLRQVLGNGRSYREVASRLGKPVGTVKARVSRLRDQIRASCADTIRPAMAAA